jgi:transaldolase/glucose-6-phosphate isomerase
LAKIRDFVELGQSIWYDYLRRAIITSGELKGLIDQGLGGVTANPAIFEKAIDGSTDYDEDLKRYVNQGLSPSEILEGFMIKDVGEAADLFRPLYDSTKGADGYVSIEVSPEIADNTEAMIAEAKRFYSELHRPNVMIKIPATDSGFPAISRLIGEGINVNVTLIFSIEQYKAATESYLSGLETFAARNGDLQKVSSVASFFVSRVDTAVNQVLEKKADKKLQGKIGIANAKIAYEVFKDTFKGDRWGRLKKRGAHVQRVLWASTGTKDPAYPDTFYVDSLIGPDTVNTIPPATLRAVLDHGKATRTLDVGLDEARGQLAQLSQLGVDFQSVTQDLEAQGIENFTKSFETVIGTISKKRALLVEQWSHTSAKLGPYESAVNASLTAMAEKRIVHRIWAHDFTVWKPVPTEISNRLGWLHIAEVMEGIVPHLSEFVEEIRKAGYKDALLLGMGGSSLAPQVFWKTFGRKEDYLSLNVLDTVDSDAIAAQVKLRDPAETLYIVSSKSGSTVETLSLMKYFYGKEAVSAGKEDSGKHFVAITDPKSPLEQIADHNHFRTKFLNDPNLGGRYSALSYYGLVPAAVLGVDLVRLLDQTITAMHACETSVNIKENPGAWLGATLGELAKVGRDKVTLITSPKIASFGDWVEQLIAESTGKEGKGLVPVIGEPVGPPEVYGNDRLFVYTRLEGDTEYDNAVTRLEETGQPVVRLQLHDMYELGRQFFIWEMAVAVAGYVIGINPFDQPNVESAKILAREMVSDIVSTGSLPTKEPDLFAGNVLVYGNIRGKTLNEVLGEFLTQSKPGNYVAIQAYVEPSHDTNQVILAMRRKIRDRYKLATTFGYGPRYLHSTGQLHKGDSGHGLFIQITAGDLVDMGIPDEMGSPASSITFSLLKQAEALGDNQALVSAGRRIVRFHLVNVPDGLNKLNEALT